MIKICFIILTVTLFACSKNDNETPASVLLNDTVNFRMGNTYQLDVDADGIKDLNISGQYQYGTNFTDCFFFADPLHAGTIIHSLNGTQPICKDSTLTGPYPGNATYNCSGGPKQIRIDSFIYTPGFPKTEIPGAIISNLSAGNILIYELHGRYMPGPGQMNISYGNFFDPPARTGWMLISVKGKRYGLLIKNAGPDLYFQELLKLD